MGQRLLLHVRNGEHALNAIAEALVVDAAGAWLHEVLRQLSNVVSGELGRFAEAAGEAGDELSFGDEARAQAVTVLEEVVGSDAVLVAGYRDLVDDLLARGARLVLGAQTGLGEGRRVFEDVRVRLDVIVEVQVVDLGLAVRVTVFANQNVKLTLIISSKKNKKTNQLIIEMIIIIN